MGVRVPSLPGAETLSSVPRSVVLQSGSLSPLVSSPILSALFKIKRVLRVHK